jgi:hypothetical protein
MVKMMSDVMFQIIRATVFYGGFNFRVKSVRYLHM